MTKHIHFIGICGVGTSAIAIAFHKAGYLVTGSDKGFYPPVSTALTQAGVSYYAGWHVDKMTEKGTPDFVIIGTASGSQNPESEYAREHGIPAYSFAEAIGKFFVRKNSVVVVGTWGKTTTSALLSWIFKRAEYSPSYMTGGIPLTHDAAELTKSEWSIFEGDEYKSAPWDDTPKFAYYRPTRLLLTAVSWDHADLYPTEESYFDVFEKIVAHAGATNPVIACIDNPGVVRVLATTRVRAVTYGANPRADFRYVNVAEDESGIAFDIVHGGDVYHVISPMLGTYNAENITGAFALALTVGIDADAVADAIHDFTGLKRRLEKRFSGERTVLSDIAHSPEKARVALSTLRNIYTQKLTVLFEPNTGGREREVLHKYDNAFRNADTVIIPRLTKLKGTSKKTIDGETLTEVIRKTHDDTHYMEDDDAIVAFLRETTKKGDCVVFLGSHGFRGIIEAVVDSFKEK